MDIARFEALLNDPAKSKDDLMTMRQNAARKSAVEHVALVERVLDKRFPEWRVVRTRRGGATPTDVSFRGEKRHFETAREAYVWLIEQFIRAYPKPFVDLDWETLFVARGPRAIFFARSLRKLFGDKDHLAADTSKHQRLSNGWYA